MHREAKDAQGTVGQTKYVIEVAALLLTNNNQIHYCTKLDTRFAHILAQLEGYILYVYMYLPCV